MSDEDWWTQAAMIIYGGSFVHWLGRAARAADPDNLARLKRAWPEYWQKYAELGLKLRAREYPSGKGQPGKAGGEAETEPAPLTAEHNER